MRFNYNGKEYELVELKEPHCSWGKSFDIIAIFEVRYVKFVEGNKKVYISKGEYDELIKTYDACDELRFINYFYGASENIETIKENAEHFIDHEYDKEFDELKYLLKNLRAAQVEFEKDFEEDNNTKGSLDGLEYAQSDIYDWVKENIKLDD